MTYREEKTTVRLTKMSQQIEKKTVDVNDAVDTHHYDFVAAHPLKRECVRCSGAAERIGILISSTLSTFVITGSGEVMTSIIIRLGNLTTMLCHR